MKQIRKTITALPSGNHSINFVKSSAEEQIYTDFIVTGTQTLTGNFNINPSGTPSIYTVVDILWNANVIPSTSNVVIFGITIPNSLLASGNFKVQCFYDALSGKGAGGSITNGWVVSIIPDASSSADVDSDRLAASSVTTAKIADNSVELAKMYELATGSVIFGNASNRPTALSVADSTIVVGDSSTGLVSVAVSGDATLAKTGALTIANDAITTAKILDANVTPAKLSSSANKGQFAVQLEFDNAAKIGVIKYQICSTCTIDGIYATVNRVPAIDTATIIAKNHGMVAMTGGQIDITTALALGNIISVTPTANNTFTAGEQLTLETSKTTAEACTVTVMVCYTVTA
jgi:hypothetical protein